MEERSATDNLAAVMSVIAGVIGLRTVVCAGCGGFPGMLIALFFPTVALITGVFGVKMSGDLDGAGGGLAKIGIGLAIAEYALSLLACLGFMGLFAGAIILDGM